MKVAFTTSFKKQLKKLDKQIAKQILDELEVIENLENPRSKGKALKGNLKDIWRYRSGDYRILCKIVDTELVIFALEVGHRKEIYE